MRRLPQRVIHFLRWAFASRPARLYDTSDRRIAFIKQARFSHINEHIAQILERNFPQYTLEVIDLWDDVVRSHKLQALGNLASVCKWFGVDMIKRRRSLRDCYLRAPYLSRMLKKDLQARFAGRESQYAFTFSTQSLFDASVPGIPHFVFTDHTHLANLMYPGFNRANLLPKGVVDCEREIYRNARMTFTMGGHVARSVVKDYGISPDRVACVYGGSNVGQPLPPENENYTNRRVLFVGVEWERKGGPALIAAFDRVLEKFPDATLTIVGCSPHLAGKRNVEVVGRVAPVEVQRHLVRSSLFVFPSRIEPFGIAPIEAMLHRIPVVVSNIGAMPEIVQEGVNGYLVDPDDIGNLAQVICNLLADPEAAQRMGEAGFRIASEKFTWEATGVRIRGFVAGVLKAGPGNAVSNG